MSNSWIRILFPALFVLCCSCLLLGQPKDSIYQRHEEILETGTPNQKAAVLLEMADQWKTINLDSALHLCYQSMKLANSFELKKELGFSYKKLCELYVSKNTIDSIIKYGDLALDDQFSPFWEPEDLGFLYIKVAFNYKRKSNWSKAYSILTKFLEQPNILPKHEVRGNTHLAGVMSNLGDYEKAVEFINQAKAIAPEDDPTIEYVINYAMVEACVHAQKFDIAKIYSERVLTYSEDGKDMNYITDRLSHANILINLEEYEEVLKIIKLLEQDDRSGRVNINMSIVKGVCFTKIGQPEKAIQHFLNAEKMSNQTGATYNLKYIYENLASTYSEVKEYKKSAHYYNQFIDFLDEENSIGTNKTIFLLELEKVKLEKDKMIQDLSYKKLQQDNKLTQIYWLGALLGLFALGGVVIYYWYNKSRESQLEEEISKNKLQALRSNMNPHFMFNSLNTLQNFILKSEKYKAYNFITNYSKLLRSILDNSDTLHASLEIEIALIRNYLELEQIRFDNNFEFSLEVDEILETDHLNVPSMIIQPYVENAIIHGLSNKNGSKLLNVSFQKTGDDYLQCIISDNGIGRAAAAEIKAKNGDLHLSMATANSIKRVEILRKMGYLNTHISIEDLASSNGVPEGTKVIILLPLS